MASEAETEPPVVVIGLGCGSSHSSALLSCNVVVSWGRGEDGQLGHGNADQVLEPKAIFDLIDKNVTSIACGAEYTVAVTADSIYSWGWGDFGRLGHGDSCDLFIPQPISFFAGHRVQAVACGDTHTLVIADDGKLFSFGRNQNGQLGLGHNCDSLSPQLVQAMENHKVTSVACGAEHSSLSTSEGKVFSWGWGRYGNLGNGLCEDRYLPTPAHGLDDKHIVSVVCGWRHSVAVCDQGQIYTFGWSKYGQLGHGSQEDQSTPRHVEAFKDKKVAVVSGGWRHTMAVDTSGVVYGWGWNKFGQLGLGDSRDRSSPCVVTFPGPVCIQRLACGWRHTLAVTNEGQVFSWGRGVNGQLGHGLEEDALQPVRLTALCQGVMSRQSLVQTTSATRAEAYVAASDRYAVVPDGSEVPDVGSGDASVVPCAPGSCESEPPAKKQR